MDEQSVCLSEPLFDLGQRELFERAVSALLERDVVEHDLCPSERGTQLQPEHATELAKAALASVSINLASPKHRKMRKE
jgi:hypothetical protein